MSERMSRDFGSIAVQCISLINDLLQLCSSQSLYVVNSTQYLVRYFEWNYSPRTSLLHFTPYCICINKVPRMGV